MKKILFALLFAPFFAFSQQAQTTESDDGFDHKTIPVVNGSILYEREEETFYASKDEAFGKAQQMIQEFVRDNNFVILKEDKNAGVITGRMETYNFIDNVSLILSVELKDGKYRAKLYSFERTYKSGNSIITTKYEDDLLYLSKNKEAPDGPHRTHLYALHQSIASILTRVSSRLAKDYEY